MLTKTDLQQIGEVIDIKLEPVKKDLKVLKKDVNYLKKSVDLVVKKYDEGDVALGKRVSRIEEHLRI
ncbi:MAG: hypothetical protein HY426_03950 [Candidatus Levybacteria bacterium]|nr:hypothetical protein [Candidatus Levybacteria bacterium]